MKVRTLRTSACDSVREYLLSAAIPTCLLVSERTDEHIPIPTKACGWVRRRRSSSGRRVLRFRLLDYEVGFDRSPKTTRLQGEYAYQSGTTTSPWTGLCRRSCGFGSWGEERSANDRGCAPNAGRSKAGEGKRAAQLRYCQCEIELRLEASGKCCLRYIWGKLLLL